MKRVLLSSLFVILLLMGFTVAFALSFLLTGPGAVAASLFADVTVISIGAWYIANRASRKGRS